MVRLYMIFSGSGPILVMTRFNGGMQAQLAREYLAFKGILKFVAYEVPAVRAEERYGTRFRATADQLSSDQDFRVMDMDGHHVFNSFDFVEMGEPVYVGGKMDDGED